MKKSVVMIFVFLIALPNLVSAERTIFSYLNRVDENYVIVLGKAGKSGDSFAAADVIVGLKKENGVDIEEVSIEGQVSPRENKILIGSPCDHGLIATYYPCESWPYRDSQAVIEVRENDLLITGSTVDATRSAAKLVRQYRSFPDFRKYEGVLIDGLVMRPLKAPRELVCGDGVCEDAERRSCFVDCAGRSCFDVCRDGDFVDAACRPEQGNPAVPSCFTGEIDHGKGWCASGRVCCCRKNQESPSSSSTMLTGQSVRETKAVGKWEERALLAQALENPSLALVLVLSLAIIAVFLFFVAKKEF